MEKRDKERNNNLENNVLSLNLRTKISSRKIMMHIFSWQLNQVLIHQMNTIFITSDSMILITYTTIKFMIVQMRLNLSKQVKLKIILERDMCK